MGLIAFGMEATTVAMTTYLHLAEARDCIKFAVRLEDLFERSLISARSYHHALVSATTADLKRNMHISREYVEAGCWVRNAWTVGLRWSSADAAASVHLPGMGLQHRSGPETNGLGWPTAA